MRSAGKRFGVTYQAVSQSWKRIFGDQKPPIAVGRGAVIERIAELARSGKTALEIGAELGMLRHGVERQCRKLGIDLETTLSRRRQRVAVALAAVANGTVRVDAAVDNQIGLGALARAQRQLGVRASSTGAGRMDGRSLRAIDRVLAGASIAEACTIERCAPETVRRGLRRRDDKLR
jgi:DNA-binding CsgD family transcriptional regulator